MPTVTLQRQSFSEVFKNISSICPTKPTTIAALKSVLFRFTETNGTLMASDSEIGIRGTVTLSSTGSGMCLLPVDRMSSILGAVVDDVITLNLTDAKIEIKCGYSKFNLGKEDPSGFPEVTEFEESLSHRTVPSSKLKEMIGKTVFAVDQAASRQPTQGVYVEDKGANLKLAATDKRRLAIIHCEIGTTAPKERDGHYPILPGKALLAVARFLGDEGEACFVQTNNQSLFRYGIYTLVTQQILGKYPDLARVIPDERYPIIIEMTSAALMTTLRQSMIMTSEESSGVKFQFTKGLVKMESFATGIGDSAVEMPISYDGADLTISLDPKFVIDFLKVIGSLPFTWEMLDGEHLIQLRCGDYLYCVMPYAV